jgi:hypothetical protein
MNKGRSTVIIPASYKREPREAERPRNCCQRGEGAYVEDLAGI